jgi:glutathione peroxidase
MSSIYSFQTKTNSGETLSLDRYNGKVLLIVNVASKCGFTPQYEGLEKLYKTYKDRGLEILAFPCNQFGGQEPGDDAEIKNFCSLKYEVTFPLFSKIEVNGDSTHPLFQYLKDTLPGVLGTRAVKWNFTKFLVDRKGQPVKRFAPKDKPEDLAQEIEALLG